MDNNNGFYRLFLQEIRDLYSAEKQLLQALPKMAEASSHEDLKAAFRAHLEETKEHIDRLDTIFTSLDEDSSGGDCEAMRGLILESEKIINGNFEPILKDAALISAAQRIDHYEMAVYGCAKTFAKYLDLSEAVSLLRRSLTEEGESNKNFISIAEGSFFSSGINALAAKC